MLRPWHSVLVREWPLLAAGLALASLALVPGFVRSFERTRRREESAIQEIRRRIESEPREAESLAREFAQTRIRSALLPEARYLYGRAIVERARRGEFPGVGELDLAWTELAQARGGGVEAERTWALQLDIARLLDERGFDALDRYRELVRASGLHDAWLDRARALARRGAFAEAKDCINQYLHSARERRIQGFLAEADVDLISGRPEEALAVLDHELSELPRSEDQGRLQLERGKALLRLDRLPEADMALRDAENRLTGTERDQALLLQAVILERSLGQAGLAACERLIRARSLLAPVASMVLGRRELRSGGADPTATFRAGLAGVLRPRLFDQAGLDFTAEFYGPVRRAWEEETHPQALLRIAALYREITRLYPASRTYLLDEASLWAKAGEPGRAADRLLAAAETLSDPSERSKLAREAAEACFRGGLYPRAAILYRQAFDLWPEGNLECLYREGEALGRASCFRSSRPGVPDALSVFAEFIEQARPDDPRRSRALLRRGKMFEDLGMHEEAVREFSRVVRPAEETGIDPTFEEWADALLGRGRALLALAGEREDRKLAAQARSDLGEYVERYSGTFGRREGSAEAGLFLARAAIMEGAWSSAMESLDRVESIAEEESEYRRQARFLRGDLLLGQGSWEAAARAYGAAYRADLKSEERLWGLVGRARAYLRLGRREDARRDYESGKAIYDLRKADSDRSLARRGRDLWGPALEALGKELVP